jgi:hypothetical protein
LEPLGDHPVEVGALGALAGTTFIQPLGQSLTYGK